MNPVTIGVLGSSVHYGLRVSIPLKKSPLIRLGAIASRSLATAQKVATEWGFERAYGSYEELLKDPGIELVYIPLPNHMHAEWIKKTADAGKAILCEKPLTLNSTEAAEALNYAKKKGILVMEAFMYRFHPQWIRARELVSIGEIGKVYAIHTMFCFKNTDPQNIRNQVETGGGATLDIGCYAASLARFIMNREPWRVVSTMTRDEEDGTDTFNSAIMDFGNAKALFTISTRMASKQEVNIYGSSGKISFHVPFAPFPDVPARIRVESHVGQREIILPIGDQYCHMFEAFAQSFRTGTPPPISTQDALANMKVLDALFESSRTEQWQKV